MFGFVMANIGELPKDRQKRYGSIYCGICRQIRVCASQTARLGLSYDMAFLSMLLMSLYEPEEQSGKRACWVHPIRPRPWVDNEYVAYGAQMNIALAYYKAMDDYRDEGRRKAKLMASIFAKYMPPIRQRYPRQCEAIETCIRQLSQMEADGCKNPDEPANCFGRLMAALFCYHDDLWRPSLEQLGMALGRFIYLADAAVDYKKDMKSGSYNPYIAMGTGENWALWDEHLTMAMARCTRAFEHLPLVQDKDILDNILYSGVWVQYRAAQKKNSPGGSTDE